MPRWACLGCGCLYAAGAPCCPQCRGTDYEEEAGVAKITALDGVSHPEEEPASGVPGTAHEYAGEAAAPDPSPDSPASPGRSGEPETPGGAVEPEAVAEVAPEPAAKPKPAPSLSRARDAPAEITGSGGVVLPKPSSGDEPAGS